MHKGVVTYVMYVGNCFMCFTTSIRHPFDSAVERLADAREKDIERLADAYDKDKLRLGDLN